MASAYWPLAGSYPAYHGTILPQGVANEEFPYDSFKARDYEEVYLF